MNKKFRVSVILILLLLFIFSVHCYAITDAEVQAAVDSSSKESVTGNIFIWFLCAIAFMKVSQKIDSFMSSLGVSVGRTGGSMMAEAMIVARGMGTAFKTGGKFAGFGKEGVRNTAGTAPAGKGGFFGGIGRKMSEGATDMATGKKNASGIMASIGKKAYEGSVGKGGSFATSVISSVARGEISRMGTISGANGKSAMESYFGYNANVSKNSGQTADINKKSKMSLSHGGATSMSMNSKTDVSGNVGVNTGGGHSGDSGGNGAGSPSNFGGSVDMNPALSGSAEAVPVFSDIEMGGGRITGIETTSDFPDGRQFAMYDAEKYAKPEGKFETVTAVDNSKWYKQYAAPQVEKTPYIGPKGKVKYHEKIVERIPKAPARKDKI